MARPVFVVGRPRSGTTWLANQIAEHPSVAAVKHERHYGMHESAFFTHVVGRYGDFGVRVNYVEFVEVMAASDYFRLAGASKEFLYSLWPTDYAGVFRSVMDRFADEQGAEVWLEKTPDHAAVLDEVVAAYPDAKFIGVIRDPVANVASAMNIPGSQRPAGSRLWALVRQALGWRHYKNIITALAASSERMLIVRYEDMRSDLEAQMRRVCAHLDLPWDDAVLRQRYKPQSSFRNATDRERALSGAERRLITVSARVSGLIPDRLLALGAGIRRRRAKRGPLPAWFFRLMPLFVSDPELYEAASGRAGSVVADPSAGGWNELS